MILGNGRLYSHGEGKYTWEGVLNVEDMQPYLEGPGPVTSGSRSQGRGIYYDVEFLNGKWSINGVYDIKNSE